MSAITPSESCEIRVTIASSAVLRTLCDMLRELVREVNFSFMPTGIRVATIDVSKTALVHCMLPSEDFQSFHCSVKFSAAVVVNVMHKLFKTSSASDNLVISVDIANRLMFLQLINPQKHVSTCYSLKLLDEIAMDVRMLNFTYKHVINQSAQNLHTLLKNMTNLASFVMVESDGTSLAFTACGEFVQQTTIVSDKGKSDRLGPIVFSGRFKLKPLVVISRCASLCLTCSIFFTDGMPLMLTYTAGPRGKIQTAFVVSN
jgi:proliferating cell nuclear antigen PCNA